MPTRPVRPVASGEKRVLLVDPDPLLRRLRAEVLRQAGYRVFPSTDLEAALTRVKPGAFDLIAARFRDD